MNDEDVRSAPAARGGLPLLGHTVALWRDPLRFLESLRAMPTMRGIVRVDVGTWPVYVLTTQELVREALVTRAESFARGRIYDRARSLFGDGLATSDGAFHQRQRRLVQPAFHHAKIVRYADIMSRHAIELADSWQFGQRVEVDVAMHELTLRTVVSALFASDIGRQAAAEVQRLMPILMKGIAVRLVTPQRLDGWPIPVNRRFDAAATQLRRVVGDVIAAYREGDREGDDLLSILLAARDAESGARMTDAQICDEVISLLMAGTETPGNTLAWTFHELAGHPEVERRLHAEIDAVVSKGPIDFEGIAKLEYTGRVLNEVLRLHPVLLFTRRAVTETELGGARIPSGTEIAYSPYALHRDPALYPEPTRFDPDRWLPERAAQLPPRAFNPFGVGRHKCIGDAFAWTEMILVLATLARRFRLRAAEGHTVREVVAEVPRPDALPMIVEGRT